MSLEVAAARAGGLTDLLRSPQFAKLALAPLGPALASAVASTYPVASASASVTYAYDPVHDTLERQAAVAGPIIGERAETIGRGQFDLGVSYSFVRLSEIDCDDLGHLVNRPSVNGRLIAFPVKGGVTLADGRFSNFLPVRVDADLGVEAHIVTPALTYGLTPNLDLNLSLPLVRTTLDITADTLAPDPRLPLFRRADGQHTRGSRSLSDEAVGVGDLLLRSKYIVHRGRPFDVAAGLGLSLPTGSQDDLHGTGVTQVEPSLIVSRVFRDRFEPLLSVGVDCNADAIDESVVRWAIGGTAEIARPLTAALVFLGRHELSARGKIQDPFFVQIRRNDFVDAAVGFRARFAENGIVGLNALVPLNRDGLRAEVIPTLQVEYAFGPAGR